jgi:uncharacterized protein
MNRKRTATRCAALFLLAVSHAAAVDWTLLKHTGYLTDEPGVTDARTRAEVEKYAERVEKKTGVQMALVIIPSLQGEPVDDVARVLYRAWGIGEKHNGDGVLLLLSLQERRSHVEVGPGLEEKMPDDFGSLLLQNMRPEIRSQQFGPVMLKAAQTIGEFAAKAKNVTLDFKATAVNSPVERRHRVPWIPILAGLVIFWLLLRLHSPLHTRRGGRSWTGMLLGNMLHRGCYSGKGAGGFGGYDSGGTRGGFDGFGGGDATRQGRRQTLSDW